MDVKKIKVLQVTAVDITVKYLLLPLIDRLTKEGYNVQVATSPGGYTEQLRKDGYVINTVDIGRRIRPIVNLKAIFALCRLIKKEKFDIVHVHSPLAAMLGRVAAKMADAPVIIYTAHGFYFHENMTPWKRRVVIWIEKILTRVCTDILLLQSAEDRETAIREGISLSQNAVWISNGVDINKFIPEEPDAQLRESFGIKKEDKVVVFAGRIVREKGIEELVKAIAVVKEHVPSVKFLIVGDTLGSDRDADGKEIIKRLIAENNLKENIIFAGLRDDMPQVYSLMDVFVLPSFREGMPRSILEAMACRKPVVATDIRGSREEVVDGVTGKIVPPREVKPLADAISGILMDEETAKKMGQAGRKRVESKFDEEMVLDKEMEVYKRVSAKKLCNRKPKTTS
ncbi:MAG: glycosyltransferase family 4 protein [Candidatus Omnitrophica bacterium]|nr:glycosyltransferase family 4 protein [Candidatus Omnitrophota bacterium]